jgi:hypothetical protein
VSSQNIPNVEVSGTVTQRSSFDPQRCEICLQFQSPARCNLVEGRISPRGWCQFFAAREMHIDKTSPQIGGLDQKGVKGASDIRELSPVICDSAVGGFS